MSHIGEYLKHYRSRKGFKAMLKNKLFAGIIQGLAAAEQDIDEQEKKLDECLAQLRDISIRLGAMDGKGCGYHTFKKDFENACINLRNNNSRIERLETDVEALRLKCSRGMPVQNTPAVSPVPAVRESSSEYDCIDYFDFENHFRGSIEGIKRAQMIYLPYFKGKQHVVDIGCGRGEFLSLMQESGIPAQGVDIYSPYVEYCRMKGLSAVCQDGAAYLEACPEVDGIFLGQVVEHMKTGEIIRICELAYDKLPEGGCLVMETPNPTTLAIYTNAFYLDPSHAKPVHPQTLRYLLEKAGFRKVEILFTPASRPSESIPALDIPGAEEFNQAMHKVSELLYGSQDYAVIAVR